jgi:hypothetical protein
VSLVMEVGMMLCKGWRPVSIISGVGALYFFDVDLDCRDVDDWDHSSAAAVLCDYM